MATAKMNAFTDLRRLSDWQEVTYSSEPKEWEGEVAINAS